MSRTLHRISVLFLTALIVAQTGCVEKTPQETAYDVLDFPNVLNVRGRPTSDSDLTAYSFSDLGAWFNFGLPDRSSPDLWGGFTGPFLLTHGGIWLSPSFARLFVEDASSGGALDWSQSLETSQMYYPGRLLQTFSVDSIEVRLDLIFVTSSTALIRAHITNAGTESRRLRAGWSGDVNIEGAALDSLPAGVSVTFSTNPTVVDLSVGGSDVQVEIEGSRYRALGGEFAMPEGESVSQYATVSLFADSIVRGVLLDDGVIEVSDLEGQFALNTDRWSGYLAAAFDAIDPHPSSSDYGSVVVKAVETLLTNWRSAHGHLFHDGLFPSYAYRGFHGVWSWDSWKHARALANFAPELAKDQIRVMFDYQDQYGMVPDVIYADSSENNWRDTKPPLSAWAVWAIYERTSELAFLEEMYPRLWRYHEWWYANRDHDVNGLCEYGSTDGTRIAAGWESGMDNAVRFDSATMVQNNDRAWSLNQESVDLNSYLYAEKLYLASMAEVLGRVRDVALLRAAAEDLREQIGSTMFDEDTGYFYDVDVETKRPLLAQGPEGWIPLWAGVATEEQADRVVQVMMDSDKFATNVPFPTLTADHEKFDPRDGYWRGSVWLDQAYFAVKGLERYGYSNEADEMRTRLFENAAGLLGDAPIHENYHPLTGEPLNAPHFSWSAAHYLLLLESNEGAGR